MNLILIILLVFHGTIAVALGIREIKDYRFRKMRECKGTIRAHGGKYAID
jgi:hypothetical protein